MKADALTEELIDLTLADSFPASDPPVRKRLNASQRS